MSIQIAFHFDSPPGPEPAGFLDTFDAETGEGVGVGKWVDNGDGTWSLIVLVDEVDIRRDT
jgi:hypothetical protein